MTPDDKRKALAEYLRQLDEEAAKIEAVAGFVCESARQVCRDFPEAAAVYPDEMAGIRRAAARAQRYLARVDAARAAVRDVLAGQLTEEEFREACEEYRRWGEEGGRK